MRPDHALNDMIGRGIGYGLVAVAAASQLAAVHLPHSINARHILRRFFADRHPLRIHR